MLPIKFENLQLYNKFHKAVWQLFYISYMKMLLWACNLTMNKVTRILKIVKYY